MKVEPGCRRACESRLNWLFGAAGNDGGHRADGAVPGVDRDHCGRRVGPPGERRADRLLREPLPARLDRRVDLEAARAHRLGAVLLDELVAHVAEEVGLADLGVEPPGTQPRRALLAGSGVLPSGDHALLEHRAQHLVAARDRAGGVDERVVGRRRLVEPGEQRRLRQGQPAGGPREVRSRSRLGAVRQVPVEDGVEVRRQDALLRPRAVELHREARLGHLALDGALVRDVEVADELLGDRRAALDDAARLDVAPERAGDAFGVDAAVVVEPAVLDRDRGLREPRRDLLERDDLPVPLRRDDPEERAVGGVDERVLADLRRSQGGEVAAVVEGEHRRSRGDAGCSEEHCEADEDERQLPGPVWLATADAPLRHRRSRRAGTPGAAHASMVATA